MGLVANKASFGYNWRTLILIGQSNMTLKQLVLDIKEASINPASSANTVTDLIIKLNQMLMEKNSADVLLHPLSVSDLFYLLHNVRKMIKKSDEAVNASVVSAILNELQLKQSPSSKFLSQAIYSAAGMEKELKLFGVVSANVLNSLLRRLVDNNPNGLDICNTIYSLGVLAKGGKLSAEIDKTELHALLLKLPHAKPSGKEIANTIYGLGELAKSKKLSAVIDNTELHTLLVHLPNNRPSAQDIANTIYGLGELAKDKKLSAVIGSTELHALLGQLPHANPSAQSIANTIYGLGELAKSKKLSAVIDTTELHTLLAQLPHASPSAQSIANTIYGLGELAKDKKLSAEIDTTKLHALLGQLPYARASAQHIANTIYGLGELAKDKKLSGVIDTTELHKLLVKLQNARPSTQHIANTIYGLGELAKDKKLSAVIDTTELQALLEQLPNASPNAQHIANTIYGLGELAKGDKLSGVIKTTKLQALLEQLPNASPSAQSIANTIYGLGELAKRDKLSGVINTTELHALLEQLQSARPSAQHIANTIYGLGELAKDKKLSAVIDTTELHKLLVKLQNASPNAQHIANTIYGLGELAKGDKLSGVIDTTELHKLLVKLQNASPNAQHIANTIYGLGELAKDKKLSAVIDTTELQALLVQLPNASPSAQDITNTIYGLGELAKRGKLSASVNTEQLIALLGVLDTHDLNLMTTFQVLQGLSALPFANELRDTIETLFQNALTNYVHPSNIISLLDYYASLSSGYALPQSIRTTLEHGLNETNLKRHQFSRVQQAALQRVQELMPELASEPIDMAETYSPSSSHSSTPVHHPVNLTHARSGLFNQREARPPHWDQACKSDVFNAIAGGNLARLCLLLGVEQVTPKANGVTHRFLSSVAAEPLRTHLDSHLRMGSRDEMDSSHKAKSTELVTNFLKRTDSACLKYVIERASHEFFYHMLYACTKHIQYQLAIEHTLNPVVLYLPTNKLSPMVTGLLDLGFYRDHRAILNLVDALFLRKTLRGDEAEKLTALQTELLNKAIDYHSNRGHGKATPRLRACLKNIQAGQETLLEMDDVAEMLEAVTTDEELVSMQIESVSPVRPVGPSLFNTGRQKRTRTDANVYVEDALMRINDGEPEANMQAYYGAETVNRLLELKLNHETGTSILGAVNYSPANALQVFRDALSDYMGHYDVAATPRLLLPIIINMHWVGVTIRARANEVVIAYHDSLKETSHQQRIKTVMEAVVGELYHAATNPSEAGVKLMMWRDESFLKQDDASSCGVYLVENMTQNVKGKIPKRMSTRELRDAHLELLKERDPVYHNKHVQLAENAVTVQARRFN